MKIQGIKADGVYKATVCNRCGDTVLRKYIKTDYLDGGYTQLDNYEKAPEGWGYHWDTGTLCPKCNDEYEKCITTFMEGGKVKVEEINGQ